MASTDILLGKINPIEEGRTAKTAPSFLVIPEERDSRVALHAQRPNAQLGRHPGQTLDHSPSRQQPGGFLLPG